METKLVVEALLSVASDTEYMSNALYGCHILNDTDRNWSPNPHSEYPWITAFTNPYFLMVVDKQVHVYVIGNKDKGKTYNVLNIEGYSCEHWTLAKSGIIKNITDSIKESQRQFLPSPISQRIMLLTPWREGYSMKFEDNIYIFNRQARDDNMLKKSKWSIGLDIYSTNQPEYTTSVAEILKECFKELEESEETT